MRPTARFWTVAAVGGALGLWGIVLDAPSLLLGGAAVGGWLLATQYRFLRDVEAALSGLTVDLGVDETPILAEEETQVRLEARLAETTPVALRVSAPTPTGVGDELPPLALDERHEVAVADLSWPVAGTFEFDAPRVTATDRHGLFTQTVAHGSSPSVVVEPRAPREIHVGRGGDETVTGFGDHDTGRTGSGLKPADVRAYVPGDTVRQIDWKATARLAEPHVREYEVETDRETRLFLDHRASMGEGPGGRTKLDYLRQVALAFVADAGRLSDSLGCYTVGGGGLTDVSDPSTADDHLAAIQRRLLSLAPTAADARPDRAYSPAAARRRADRLAADGSRFATILRPYFQHQDPYVEQFDSEPLFTAVRRHQTTAETLGVTVLLTDDARRAELRETVRLARRTGGQVLVFLAPTVLYRPGGLGDLADAYDEYVEFEEFRRSLDALDRVTAYEVGPRDRLTAVLDAGRADARRGSA